MTLGVTCGWVRSPDLMRGSQEGIVAPVRHVTSRSHWEAQCADRLMRYLQPAFYSRSL
jgi:hypothetical protein